MIQRHSEAGSPGGPPRAGWSWVRAVALAGVVSGAAGCSAPGPRTTDFDRHRYSQLVQPEGPGGPLFFDVTFSADYPRDDPAADAARLAWLEGWLKRRGLCAAGFDVTVRRPFDYLESNPARHDERWAVACRTAG
jgi:hypothetical protein